MVLQPAAPDVQKPPRTIQAPAWFTWALKDGKAVVAFVGVLVYGVARTATEAFYRTFHLSPEEVGVSHAAIIGKAALYLVLFLAAVAAVVVLPTAAGMRLQEAMWKKEWGAGHGHVGHTSSEQAAGLWGLLAALGFLPVVLTVLSPEFTHFLLGYAGPGDNDPMTLRLALGAWTTVLAVVAYLALQSSCPLWNRVHPNPAWLVASFAVFVPLLVGAGFGALVRHTEGPGATAARWLQAVALLWPLVIAVALGARNVRSWRRRTRPDAATQLGLSAVWGSLVFYALVFPLTTAVLSENTVRSWFPARLVLDRHFEQSYSARADLGVALAARVTGWLLFVGLAALVAWWLSGCRAHQSAVRPAPRSATVALIGLAGFAVTAVLLIANERGEVLAVRAQDGDFIRPTVTLLVVSADPVCLSGNGAPAFLGPYMYLGKASNKHILYDLGSPNFSRPRRTFLVPGDARISYVGEDVFSESARDRAARTCAARASLDSPPPAAPP